MNTNDKISDYVLVPRGLVDRFPEINPSNYGHDDACALNDWGVELVLAIREQIPAPAVGDAIPTAWRLSNGSTSVLTSDRAYAELWASHGIQVTALFDHPQTEQAPAVGSDALNSALNFVSWFTSGNSTQHDPVFVSRKLGSKLITEANELRDKLNAAIAAQTGGEK